MKAIILAGGKGTRLRPYTENTPKPMVLIDGIPVIQYQIEQLRRAGITEILIAEDYLAQKIVDFCGDGSRFGVSISHVPVNADGLSTAEVVKSIVHDRIPELERDIVVMSGDIISTANLSHMVAQHVESGDPVTVLEARYKIPLSVIRGVDKRGHISDFASKPYERVNGAIVVMTRGMAEQLSPGGFFSQVVIDAKGCAGIYYEEGALWEHVSESRDDVVRITEVVRAFKARSPESEIRGGLERAA